MKKRLDVLVYEKGFAESREKAKAVIMAGQVYVDNQKADKCGASYDENVKLEVRGGTLPYVSRGVLKLEKAIKEIDDDYSEWKEGKKGEAKKIETNRSTKKTKKNR